MTLFYSHSTNSCNRRVSFEGGAIWSEEALDPQAMSRIETFVWKIEDGETRKSMRDLLVKGARLEQYWKRLKQGAKIQFTS